MLKANSKVLQVKSFLQQYTDGIFTLFDGQTNIDISGQFMIYGIPNMVVLDISIVYHMGSISLYLIFLPKMAKILSVYLQVQ
jgi:hypothetical protein